MKRDRNDFYYNGSCEDDFSSKRWKKWKKILKKNENIITSILQSKDHIVYKIDYDIDDDKMREDYYSNLIDSIIDNHQNIISTDDEFDVWVNDSELTVNIDEVKISIYPNSIETNNSNNGSYEFYTKTNYHKKYFKSFLEIESYKDFKQTSEKLDVFISTHKLNRNKDIEELIQTN